MPTPSVNFVLYNQIFVSRDVLCKRTSTFLNWWIIQKRKLVQQDNPQLIFMQISNLNQRHTQLLRVLSDKINQTENIKST